MTLERKHRMFVCACMASAALSLLASSEAGEFVLAEGGKPHGVIVVAENADAAKQNAAKLLADFAERISGARLPIVVENAPEAAKRPAVIVGMCKLAERLNVSIAGLGSSGIRIVSGEEWLVLAGPDKPEEVVVKEESGKLKPLPLSNAVPSGTLMAVITFLEQQWDVDWLFAGELGVVHPKRERLTVQSGLDMRYTPPFANRQIRNVMYNQRAADGAKKIGADPAELQKMAAEASNWFKMQRLGVALDLKAGHSFGKYWERFGKEHPEWFALQPDGTRDQKGGERARLCKSNPELRAQIARDAIEFFKQNPTAASYSICPNDGGQPWFCTCENCRAWDVPEAGMVQLGSRTIPNMSDRVWRFATDIAQMVEKECPGKLLTCYAYSAYKDPPRRKLHFPENLVIGVVGGTETMKAWVGVGGWKFWRPNAFNMVGLGENMAYTLARDIRTAYEIGVTATDMDGNLGHWTACAIDYYVAAKMLWNPTSSADEWIERFCRLGFGKAAPTLRRYFDRAAQLHAKIREFPEEERPSRRGGLDRFIKFYTDEWIEESQKLLRQAEKEAEGDDRAVERIRRFITLMDITKFRTHFLLAKHNFQQAREQFNAQKLTRAEYDKVVAEFREWEKKRAELYREHAFTWILNTSYLEFYGT